MSVALPGGPLRARDVGLSRGGTRVLEGVRLALHPGEMCALIGPSGAGKSTLIKVLLGVVEPDEGSVDVGGRPVSEVGPLGYVPQEDALHRGLTAERELRYAAELRMAEEDDATRRARVAEVLRQVGLSDRAGARIRRLSGGQRKRVSLALELLTQPPLLILDEPTSGLDPGLEAQTMALLSSVARSGCIVLVATHAMESLDRADALCVLVDGRVAFFGPPQAALAYFRVERYADLFRQLEKQSPRAWALTLEADPALRAFLDRAGPTPTAPVGAPAEEDGEDTEDALARLKARMGRGDVS